MGDLGTVVSALFLLLIGLANLLTLRMLWRSRSGDLVEARPAGGMGVCRQAKDEIYDCPPVLLVVGRADDGWLATWSRADAVVSQPIDPAALALALAGLMRQRAAGAPVAQP